MIISPQKLADRRNMRKILPPGSGKEIAKATGVSENTVSKFFKAKSDNHKVKVMVLKMIDAIDKEDKLLDNGVKSILAKI